MKERYVQIDALKGAAIFLVVLGHSIIVHPINLHTIKGYMNVFLWLSSVHLPLFYIVSGFCFSYKNDYKSYIIKKIKRILIPFIAFSTFGIALKEIFPNIVNRTDSLPNIIRYTLLQGGEYVFLYNIFIIFLIYPVIYKFIQNSIVKSAVWILFLIVMRCVEFKCSLFSLGDVAYYLIFFSIGAILKNFMSDKIFNIDFGKFLNIVMTIISFTVWIFLLSINKSYLSQKTLTSMLIVTFFGIITIYMCTKFKTFNNFFARFGKYSLQIYLLNGYLLVLSRTIIITFLRVKNPIIIVLFNMLVDFFMSYIVIKYILEKIKPVKRLMGMI